MKNTAVICLLAALAAGCRTVSISPQKMDTAHQTAAVSVQVKLKEGPVVVKCKNPNMHPSFGPVALKWLCSLLPPDGPAEGDKYVPSKKSVAVEVPGVGCYVFVVDGKISPVIQCGDEYWRIDGLGAGYENTTLVVAGSRQITLSHVREDADMTRRWALDFTDPSGMLVIVYDEDGGW